MVPFNLEDFGSGVDLVFVSSFRLAVDLVYFQDMCQQVKNHHDTFAKLYSAVLIMTLSPLLPQHSLLKLKRKGRDKNIFPKLDRASSHGVRTDNDWDSGW
jgi:hypothetical protein